MEECSLFYEAGETLSSQEEGDLGRLMHKALA